MSRRFASVVGIILLAACAVALPSPAQPTRAPTTQPATLRAAWAALRGRSVVAGVTVLDDNAEAWSARWELLSGARDTIDATYFIINDDVFGLALLGKLLERAEHGVGVRLLIDARGSRLLAGGAGDFLQELVQSGGVDVRVFNPMLPQVLRSLAEGHLTAVASGTHNKIIVVDDRIAITGGRNVGVVYFAAQSEDAGAVTDADVLVDGGGAVAALTDIVDDELEAPQHRRVLPDVVNIISRRDELLLISAAMDAWVGGTVSCDASADVLLAHAVAATSVGDAAAIAAAAPRIAALTGFPSLCDRMPSRPSPRFAVEANIIVGEARVRGVDNRVGASLILAIDAASESIVFESPYFILTPAVLRALAGASRRGVSITLLTNSPLSSDNALTQALFIDSWPEIIARVPTLRVFVAATPHMQHGKRAVFDDELTFIGSNNLDPFSLHLNSETVVAVWSRGVAGQTQATLAARRDNDMVEYRVARDIRGDVVRKLASTPGAGGVVVAWGPADHVPGDQVRQLRALKWLLIAQRNLWDFDVLVW